MLRSSTALLIVLLAAPPAVAGSVTLSIRDGLVSLQARDASIREILAEWARLGQTQFVNLERVSPTPLTLAFENVPEKQALDIILRAVPGYVAARRALPVVEASMYERILIMPTTTAVAALRPPPSSFPGTGTTLRPAMPELPGADASPNPAVDQMDDPALAAAAAAGLVPVPAPMPGPTTLVGTDAPKPSPAPPQPTPANPWGATATSPLPSLAAPPPQQPAPPPDSAAPQQIQPPGGPVMPRPPSPDQ
jgi:hypothetical protein